MKCIDHLREDHKVILRSLNVLQSMAEGQNAEGHNAERVDPDDAATILRFLHGFVDQYHHLKEEGILFPEVMRTNQAEGGPFRHLLFEHSQERSLVEGLEVALLSRKVSEFALFANRLTSRIRTHIEKEDGILFPILEVLISKSQDEKVNLEFEKLQLDPSLLADLRLLERKYLRGTAS